MEQDFGTFLANKRKEKGLTMREFASRLDITAPYLSDIEKGRRAAPENKLTEIANILNLSTQERDFLFDAAARTRDNQAPADISGYIMNTSNARVALRRAQQKDFSDKDWESVIKFIEGR